MAEDRIKAIPSVNNLPALSLRGNVSRFITHVNSARSKQFSFFYFLIDNVFFPMGKISSSWA